MVRKKRVRGGAMESSLRERAALSFSPQPVLVHMENPYRHSTCPCGMAAWPPSQVENIRWLGLAETDEEREAFRQCAPRARPRCRFVLPLNHFIPDSLTYSVHLFLKR